jgi:UDP-N-acetylglucosamine 2-epimerase (non-hydrolysing)
VVLVTSHRRESWGEPMRDIGRAIAALASARPDVVFVFPIHANPVVREAIVPLIYDFPNVIITEPQPYAAFVRLIERADIILTDSGGVQEEGPGFGKPVLVMRESTERPEAISAGTARLVGTDPERIYSEVMQLLTDPAEYARMATAVNPYGDGFAALRTVAAIAELLGVGTRMPEFEASRPMEPVVQKMVALAG